MPQSTCSALRNMMLDGTLPRLVGNYLSNRLGRYKPSSMEIAVNYACNLRCKHCNTTTIMDGSTIDFETLRTTFSEFDRLGGVFTTITGGEPTLRKDLPDIVAFIKKNTKLRVSIVTNGTLLDEPLVSGMKKAGLDNFLFSLYGNRDHHDGFTKVEGSYDKTLAGVKLALKYNINTCILTVPTKETLRSGSLEHILNLAKELNVHVRINLPTCSGRVAEGHTELLDAESLKEVYALYSNNRVSTDSIGFFSNYRCPSSLSAFYVTAYGDVTPCPFIQFSFGNVKESPLADIFDHVRRSRYPEIRFGKYKCPPAEDADFIDHVIRNIYQYEKIPVHYSGFRELSAYLNSAPSEGGTR